MIKRYCYTDRNGEDIYLFTLYNSKGTAVSITNFGATITAFKVKMNNNEVNDIVLGFEDINDYSSPGYLRQYPWFGCAVGRYANRVKNAEFAMEGKKFILTKNNGNNQLHGGKEGFDRKTWRFIDMGEFPYPFLELKYISPADEEGYPGNLEVLIRFELNDDNELSHQYTALCDQPTPVNLTHHSYFNLHNGEGNILDQEVKIFASHMLEQDKDLVATGKIFQVEGTPYDLREFKMIGEGQVEIGEYDKSFVIDNKNDSLQLVAVARSVPDNITLKVFSTEPILHFYSGKWTPLVKGKEGKMYGPYSGFCLETHNYDNAVNIPHFPDTILRPGEKYFQKTIYRVSNEI